MLVHVITCIIALFLWGFFFSSNLWSIASHRATVAALTFIAKDARMKKEKKKAQMLLKHTNLNLQH